MIGEYAPRRFAPQPDGGVVDRETGISIRFVKQYDVVPDLHPTRLDIETFEHWRGHATRWQRFKVWLRWHAYDRWTAVQRDDCE